MTGFPFKSEGFTQNPEDLRLLRGVNVSPGRIRWTDVVRWPQFERDNYSAFELQAGDIVLGMDRPIIQVGTKPEPELDRLSNILKVFNDQFGNIPWTDADRVHRLITEDIPNRVAADKVYQNAKQNSDKQNARVEHDKALARVMTAVLKDDTELFKQFMDNEGFRRWLTDTVFGITYETPSPYGRT